jgi:hypothetical protein
MIKGEKAWIRVRGAPNDPEAFDLATWQGAFWEIPRVNSLGEPIFLQISDYLVIERLPHSAKPEDLFRSEQHNEQR